MPHYCPQCDAEVGEHAARCSSCPAKFTFPSSFRPVHRAHAPAARTIYRLALFITPFAALFATFAGLCMIECTALPWFGFIIGPVAAIVCTVAVGLLAGRRK
jgi:hypothetical protein